MARKSTAKSASRIILPEARPLTDLLYSYGNTLDITARSPLRLSSRVESPESYIVSANGVGIGILSIVYYSFSNERNARRVESVNYEGRLPGGPEPYAHTRINLVATELPNGRTYEWSEIFNKKELFVANNTAEHPLYRNDRHRTIPFVNYEVLKPETETPDKKKEKKN